jgi:hypothetical protein
MTYPAGIMVASLSGKLLIVHVHSTGFGRNVDKLGAVYNSVERNGSWSLGENGINKGEKIVLFRDRITVWKGHE